MPPSKKKGKVVAGQRDRKLDQAFRSTVRSALKGIPADEWQAYVPPGLLSREVMEAAFDAYQQTLHQARVFIDREFEEICEESRIADKLQTIDVMCAEQGYYGGGAEVEGEGTKASQAGPKMARAATLKAKREALEHLRRIKEDVEKRNGALEGLLEERKGEARALEAAGVAGLGSRLDGVGRLVAGWEREQEG